MLDGQSRHKDSSSCGLGRCKRIFAVAAGQKVFLLHARMSVVMHSVCQTMTDCKCLFELKEGAALARWVFINPRCIVKANKFVQRRFKQCPKGFDKCIQDGSWFRHIQHLPHSG